MLWAPAILAIAGLALYLWEVITPRYQPVKPANLNRMIIAMIMLLAGVLWLLFTGAPPPPK